MAKTLKYLMLGLLLVVIAISVGCTTQAPEAEQTSEVPQAADPFIGTWNLNLEKSAFAPGSALASLTRTVEDRGGGFMIVTRDGIDAQGNRTFSQVAFKRDGKDYPVLSLGANVAVSISKRPIDAYTEEIIQKVDGKVTSTTTATISKDGDTMTFTNTGTNAQGEQTSSTEVFERQPTDSSAFVGTWKLNVEKSTFDPGPAPRNSTNTIEDRGDGVLLVTREGIDAQGNPIFIQFAAKFDGKDYPFPAAGAKEPRSITYRLLDAYRAEGIFKLDGKVVETNTRRVSRDGKTMTFTAKGTNAQGQSFDNVMVHDRQ